MDDEIKDYIRQIRERIDGLVPEGHMGETMRQISNIVVSNWVDSDGDEYKLKMTQVIALVRESVGKYKDN
jgi:hypothetical protein